jgi:hypothetical protein
MLPIRNPAGWAIAITDIQVAQKIKVANFFIILNLFI